MKLNIFKIKKHDEEEDVKFTKKKVSIKKIIFLVFLLYFFNHKNKFLEEPIYKYKKFIKNCNKLKIFYPSKNKVSLIN